MNRHLSLDHFVVRAKREIGQWLERLMGQEKLFFRMREIIVCFSAAGKDPV